MGGVKGRDRKRLSGGGDNQHGGGGSVDYSYPNQSSNLSEK